MNKSLFKPGPVLHRLFKDIRNHLSAHPVLYKEAAALIIQLTEEAASAVSHPRNLTFARLIAFQKQAWDWDLSHYPDNRRATMARAILYATWLMTDPEAGSRGVRASEMESTPMPSPDDVASEEESCLNRGWAKWEAFDDDNPMAKRWLEQIEMAWEEIQSDTSVWKVADEAPALNNEHDVPPARRQALDLWRLATAADPQLRTSKAIHKWLADKPDYADLVPKRHETLAKYVRDALRLTEGKRVLPAVGDDAPRSARGVTGPR